MGILKLNEIISDQIRLDGLNEESIKRYAHLMKGETWVKEPLKVKQDIDGKFYMSDGHHRKAAAELNGETEYPCDVTLGNRFDARFENFLINKAHGLPLKDSERIGKEIIKDQIKNRLERGDKDFAREMARETGYGHVTISRWISEIEDVPNGTEAGTSTESKDKAADPYTVKIGPVDKTNFRMRAYPGGIFIVKGMWLTQELADKVNAQKFTDIGELKLFVKNHKPEEPKPEEPKPEEPKPEEPKPEEPKSEEPKSEEPKREPQYSEGFKRVYDKFQKKQEEFDNTLREFETIAQLMEFIVGSDVFYEMLKIGRNTLILQCHSDVVGGEDEKTKEINKIWNAFKKFMKRRNNNE